MVIHSRCVSNYQALATAVSSPEGGCSFTCGGGAACGGEPGGTLPCSGFVSKPERVMTMLSSQEGEH